MASSIEVDLANKYQQKTDKQHILDNPDTYIGSVEKIDSQQWILNDENSRIFERNIEYVPGLFKLFDEGIVNARDHSVRMTQAIANGQQNLNKNVLMKFLILKYWFILLKCKQIMESRKK